MAAKPVHRYCKPVPHFHHSSMGSGDLPRLLKKDLKKAGLEALSGKTAGIDIWVIFHRAIATDLGSAQVLNDPALVCTDVVVFLRDLIADLDSLSITAIFVFDGRHHKVKGSEDMRRRDLREKAVVELATVYASDPEGPTVPYDKCSKLRKAASTVTEMVVAVALAYLRERGIAVVGSPYEADFQLVELEKSGETHFTISPDSDLFTLGSNYLVMDYSPGKGGFHIVRTQARLKTELGGGRWTDNDFRAFGVFLGNDYVPRLLSNGPVKVAKFMERWILASDADKSELLQELGVMRYPPVRGQGGGDEGGGVGGAGKRVHGKVASDYAERFREATRLMEFAPVLRLSPGGSAILAPLNPLPLPLPLPSEASEWSALIGFNPSTDFATMDIGDVRSLRIWARTGRPLLSPPPPCLPEDSSITLPFGALINFSKIPPIYLPRQLLVQWAELRGETFINASTHEHVAAVVLRMFKDPSKKIVKHDHGESPPSSSAFENWGVVSSADGSPVSMERDGSIPAVREKVGKIDMEYIATNCATGNGVRQRAETRVLSGHYDLTTLSHSPVTVKGVSAWLFHVKCKPSMKSNLYDVWICVNSEGDMIEGMAFW